MALSSGTRLGPYEILAPIGAGGMGEVYKATDTHLKRQVAIKVLPASVAADAERLARFQREAEVLAALNHPNIAQIHGLEKSVGITALVMELVEGPTLADRIAQGAIPIDEALPIAEQIAEALEAAHELGIIHRDLKPANIKVKDDGTVKVLDFGLAKAVDQGSGIGDQGSGNATNAPTISSPAMMPRLRQGYGEAGTMPGMILGTAAYMAPEQAKGRAVDKRGDIWAFGCVLFEMLTGTRAFPGDDVSETLAAVIKGDPEWTLVPADVPAAIRKLLRRCLEKDPQRRQQAIGDARLDVNDALAGATDDGTAGVTPLSAHRSTRALIVERAAWAAVGALVAVAMAVGLGRSWRAQPPRPPVVRVPMEFSDGVNPVAQSGNVLQFAVSPDGKSLAFSGSSNGTRRVWLRPLNGVTATPVAGTDNVAGPPAWSPDSQSLAFWIGNQMKRVSLRDGGLQTVCALPDGVPNAESIWAAWNADGVIVFGGVQTAGVGLFRVPAAGGTPLPLTKVESAAERDGRPDFLPDGQHFVFVANDGSPSAFSDATVYVGSLTSSDRKLLVRTRGWARFAAPDQLVYVRGQAIVAQRLDISTLTLVGDPTVLADDYTSAGNAPVSVSQTGVLVYDSGRGQIAQLTIVDRTGKSVATVAEPGRFQTLSISPDQRRIAYGLSSPSGTSDVWITDLVRNTSSRLTFGDGSSSDAKWSPDGATIIFNGTRKGVKSLYMARSTGSAERPLLASGGPAISADSWSRDGKVLLYHPDGSREQMALPLSADQKPFLVFRPTVGLVDEAEFSPDGRWIAYNANESGRYEVYVRRFPPSDDKWQISVQGGSQPRWRGDGRELFYLAPDGSLMAVDVTTGAAVDAGQPRKLFGTSLSVASNVDQYVVDASGDRFVIMLPLSGREARANLVINWPSLLPQ